MKLKTLMGIVVGKTAYFILSKMGRGSTLPGKLALKCDKNILDTIAKDYEIVVVTGTNGKTLTTALTVGILQQAFGEIVTNPSGANMITGITSTFLTAKKSPSGKKLAVLEIDEASLPKISDYITPSLFVFTNIFRDQMDRYGEIYTTYQMILDGAAKAPQATILANGDSPLFNSKKVVNPMRYYGFDTGKHEPQLPHYNTEGILCPNCQQILKYKLNTYANLGDYICENCNFKRPQLDYKLTELTKVSNTTSEFVIDGQDYKINVGGLYNIYNALAAVSVAEFFGVTPKQIKTSFNESRAVFGRQETFKIGNKSCTLILIKNPVGASQALDMIKLAPYPFTLSVLLNANYADGIDTSWIWDANFESIMDMDIPQIFTGGVRHSEISRRLRVTGYDENKMTDATQLTDIMNLIENQDTEHAYILATYTAMLEFRDILANHHAVGREMN